MGTIFAINFWQPFYLELFILFIAYCRHIVETEIFMYLDIVLLLLSPLGYLLYERRVLFITVVHC